MTSEFLDYRAVREVRLAVLEKKLAIGQIVGFNGVQVRFGDTLKDYPEFAAAIKAGWVVHASSDIRQAAPTPADIKMHKPISNSTTREEVGMPVVSPDEKDVAPSRRTTVAPTPHAPRPVSKTSSLESDGVEVGRFKTKPSSTIQLGTTTPTTEPTGGLEVSYERLLGKVSDSYAEFIDNTPPAPDVEFGARAKFGSGSSSFGGEEDGEVVGRIGSNPQPSVPSPQNVTYAPQDADVKLAAIRMLIPNFEWDLSLHWRKRAAKAAALKDNLMVFVSILSIETDAVRATALHQAYGKPSE
jgi:hypothetical protein